MNETNKSITTVPSGKIPSMSTPGEKTFYIFTSEVENVDENKLKVPADSFSVHTLVVNKGDKVTVHFYNVDDVKTERHSFTIGDPYKVDIDLGSGQNGNATFTADHSGLFTYYCRYHVPVMTGQLLFYHSTIQGKDEGIKQELKKAKPKNWLVGERCS